MPVEVPKEPKKYTTVYDNFKGVDFTDDASNVYRRRSPSGLNMLPDLDGRPSKRTGWEVKLNAGDYYNACGVLEYDDQETYNIGDQVLHEGKPYACAVEIETAEEWDEEHWTELIVEPKRVHYFSYDSYDFLMIFNSLGVFYYNNRDFALTKAEIWSNNQPSEFPPQVTRKVDGQDQTVVMPADANRAFFFEGSGTAGFYTFVESDLYRFGENDAGDYYYMKVEPTVPIFLIGCDPTTGAGTDNRSLNMLTEKRTLEYFGNGGGTFQLPTTPDANSISVSVMSPTTGEWDDPTYSFTYSAGVVTISPAPAASTVGNVRITYAPSDGSSYILTTGIETAKANVRNVWEQVSTQEREFIDYYEYNVAKKAWVKLQTDAPGERAWTVKSTKNTFGTAQLSFTNIYNQSTLKLYSNYSRSWRETSPTKTWKAYNTKLDVSFRDPTIATNYGTQKTSTTGWSNYKTTTETFTGTKSPQPFVYQTVTYKTVHRYERRTKTVTKTRDFQVYGTYTQQNLSAPLPYESRDAFNQCRKVLNFGNNITNQVFLASTTAKNFSNRVWYCAANDPKYFPDTNYIEVGADDKEVMGLIKVGSYLGIVKKGSGTEASIYLAYATSFEEDTTYAVKQSVSGIGAVSNGAFNILNEEPLFLSEEGVMGINIEENDTNRQIRNRSFFINKRLKSEPMLENAISFVYRNMYYLAINGHCYVLDGSQKSSWANEKTNLQYECYYLDNMPIQCFARFDGELWFVDDNGYLCRFRSHNDQVAYVDDYYLYDTDWGTSVKPVGNEVLLSVLAGVGTDYAYLTNEEGAVLVGIYNLGDTEGSRYLIIAGEAGVGQTVRYRDQYYTIDEVIKVDPVTEEPIDPIAKLLPGVPVYAEWSTLADDDDMVHFFKNLSKKGCVVSTMPESADGVDIYLRPDYKTPIFYGTMNVNEVDLPYDVYVRKKIKKYKRLQIIVKSNKYNDGFGIDQIIKTYTVGNYSKNRK